MNRPSALRRAGVLWAAFVGAAVGCGPTRPFLPARPSDLPTPPPSVPEDPPPVVHPKLPVTPAAALEVPEAPDLPMRRPENILALSGGGAYGAFTAGVLNGWTRSNNRPEFDVVTGISTGALIAPLAFLGPDFDADLKRGYTEVARRDVFSARMWVMVPLRDAVGSSAPLKRMVAEILTDDVVARIAAEHRKGRRLYVGTTHLESRRPIVWDIGAIAAQGGPESRRLICDVLVASCAVPGVFPPVPITVEVGGKPKTEMHVDGGVTASVFVPPAVLELAGKGDKPAPPANLFVIVAGRYYPAQAEVRPRLVRVVKASGGALLSAHTRRDLSNLYHMGKLTGVRYNSLALRQDFPANDIGFEFDQKVMTQLFVEGVKVGLEGPVWDNTPPDRGAGDVGEIRTGPELRPKP